MGGARGIGRGIASALAADGYDVAFTYSGSAEQAAELSKDLQARYPSQTISSHQFDLSDRDQVDEFATLIGDTEALYGLAYNAGGSYDTLAALVDQDAARGNTYRRLAIRPFKPHAAGRDLIDVRRADFAMAVAAGSGCLMLIRTEE